MGKIRKRKLPITAPSERRKRPSQAAMSTPKPQSTRNVITKFHNALKHRAAILSLGDRSLLNGPPLFLAAVCMIRRIELKACP